VVRLGGPISFSEVASVHADDDEARDVVTAAAVALRSDGLGPTYALEDADACELLWFATQEIPGLIESAGQ
jgi:hypothetical protein